MNTSRVVRTKNNKLFIYYQHNFITAPFSYFDPGDKVKVFKCGDFVAVGSMNNDTLETHWKSSYEH